MTEKRCRNFKDQANVTIASRAEELLREQRQNVWQRVDRMFAMLMLGQWLFAIVVVIVRSPFTWDGNSRSLHPHLYAAVVLGGLLSSVPIFLAWFRPGHATTRYTIAVAQMLWSALLIHLLGGRIETHFHVFGSLAFLAFYREWKVLVPAAVVVVVDHFVRGFWFPTSVYGVANPEWWRFLEHGGWVLFTCFFLTIACVQSAAEMREMARRQAEVENLEEAERQRANNELDQLGRKTELILNGAADGIVGEDINGRATFLNPAAEKLLGWSLEEMAGKSVHEVVHQVPDGAICPLGNCPIASATNKLSVGESSFLRKDGSTLWVEFSAASLLNEGNAFAGSVVTFRDASERRAVQIMQDEFVSVVSHELRTPLTSIRGALGLLAGGRIGELPEKGKRMLDIAVANTDRLVRLINDILDIERMKSGKITLTEQLCDAHELMWQAIELIRPIAEKAHVTLECPPCDARLWADPDRLLQTFSNLLSNAVKFSLPGASVSLSASVEDGHVVFEVADRGRGIPADKLDLIFERFQQVDASDSREKGGTGLGLAICRTIVQQHGGEIHVESTPGQGSRFRFTIPLPVSAVTAPSIGVIQPLDDMILPPQGQLRGVA